MEVYDALSALQCGKVDIPFLFVGMSGAGKSSTTNILARDLSLQRKELDAVFANRVEKELRLKMADVAALGEFLGQPDTDYPTYRERELQLLKHERQVMVAAAEWDVPLLDLSGSALYHPEALQELINGRIVICMDIPDDRLSQMFIKYQKNPKPVFFHGKYNPKLSLKRNYQTLLLYRRSIYREIANVSLSKWEYKREKGVEVKASEILMVMQRNIRDTLGEEMEE